MEAHWVWWMVAVALVTVEIFIGTFYLFAVAAGLAFAGLSAYLGAGWGGQALVAAVLCLFGVVVVDRWRKSVHLSKRSRQFNNIGQIVHIVSWSDGRRARVSYCGAEWDAELASGVEVDLVRQTWFIKDIVGTRLIIE